MSGFHFHFLRRKSPLVAWLAVFVLLVQTMAPAWASVSHSTPLAVQLCSAHGAKTIYLDVKNDSGKVHQQTVEKNCHCCLTGASAPPVEFAVFQLNVIAKQHVVRIVSTTSPVYPDANFRWHARLKQEPPLV